jgi:hypothetical protein
MDNNYLFQQYLLKRQAFLHTITFVPLSKINCSKYCLENWISACRKLKLDPRLSFCTGINSKWIKDLNIRPQMLKLVQERKGNTLEAIGIGNDFLNRTQMAQQIRERIDKWDHMKLKLSSQQKKWSVN